MGLERFGPFAKAFEKDGLRTPAHYTLLWMSDDCEIVIDRIQRSVSEGNTDHWVATLLSDPDWRPHIIAAVALLVGDQKTASCDSLWAAIDAGSWVTPQLIATAFFADAEFSRKASERVEQRCPVNVPMGLHPAERHGATGPASVYGRSAKMTASILAVCSLIPSLSENERKWRDEADIQELLVSDASRDKSDDWALCWLYGIQTCLSRRGIVLTPGSR